MSAIAAIFLFLHVLGAIVAFGPTFAFPLMGSMGGKEPMHANFATRVSYAIAERMTLPLAIVQGITGLGLIWSLGINLFATRWLLLGIVIYLVALAFSFFVQAKAVEHVIELTSTPPGGAPAMAPAEGPGAAPAGPPPAVREAVQRVQRGGMFLTVAIVVIIFLMVVKPTF